MVDVIPGRWNTVLASLLRIYEKLKKPDFAYYNGKVTIIGIVGDNDEVREIV